MQFAAPLVSGRILKRYKRFLADVRLDHSQEVITVHTPNTGSMKSCWEPQWKVLLSHKEGTDRKYPYTLEMIHNGKTWIGINTHLANKIVHEALLQNKIPELVHFDTITPEKKVQLPAINHQGRLDFYLENSQTQQTCYLEVKNVTLGSDDGIFSFPDSPSERGIKHLEMLTELKTSQQRAVIFYLVQRMDGHQFRPADEIDPAYGTALRRAHAKGVEILVYQCHLSAEAIFIQSALPFNIAIRP